MPQRFLRPGITNSEKWNGVSFGAQSLFIRILTLVDDFGRYDGRIAILHGHCFSMRPDVTVKQTAAYRSELQTNDLISIYEATGREYLQVNQWQERARSDKSKFPDPPQNTEKQDSAADGSGAQPNPASIDHRPSTIVPRPSNNGHASADADLVVKFWNESKLPKVQTISDDRSTSLRARLKDTWWIANYGEGIKKADASPFCHGTNNRGWKATFDWFIQPGTLVKIMEGKYDRSGNATTSNQSAADRKTERAKGEYALKEHEMPEVIEP